MTDVTKKPIREKQYIVTLKNISAKELIGVHFGGITTSLIDEDEKVSPSTTIRNVVRKDIRKDLKSKDVTMSDILHENDKMSKRVQYFFDIKKNKIKVWPVMVDTQKGSLPLYTNKPCRNCHHPYDTHPYGCPIKYNPHIPLTVVSNVHNSSSVILRDRVIAFLTENNLPTDTNDFFETEKMFCSLPCVKSYILGCLSNSSKAYKYKKSLSYLTLMYKKIYGIEGIPSIIPKAGPIDTLEAYGGHLSIEEYRASFGLIQYEETPNVRRPYMYSSSDYIEETKDRLYTNQV